MILTALIALGVVLGVAGIALGIGFLIADYGRDHTTREEWDDRR